MSDIRIANLRCDDCGSDEVVCIAPGSEEVRDLFLLARGVPIRCRCMACWPVLEAEAVQ